MGRNKLFSIVQDPEDFESRKCFQTGSTYWTELHHIFGGPNRKNSEKYGLMVYLGHYVHNEPPNGVHHNKRANDQLRRMGQRAFERHYPDLDFKSIFGRNFL